MVAATFGNKVAVLSAMSGELIATVETIYPYLNFADFSPDGYIIITGSKYFVDVWSLNPKKTKELGTFLHNTKPENLMYKGEYALEKLGKRIQAAQRSLK